MILTNILLIQVSAFLVLVAIIHIVNSNDDSLLIKVDKLGIPTFVVELGIVCDYQFSNIFNFNLTKITEFMVNEIRNLDVAFQTLNRTKISFRITDVQIITSLMEQPFVEEARQENGKIFGADMYQGFKKWAYQSTVANASDALLLFTGERPLALQKPALEVICKADHINREFQSLFIVEYSRDNWRYQDTLINGFGKMLGGPDDWKTSCIGNNWIMGSNWDGKFSFYFSECSDFAIWKFVTSELASCLHGNVHYFNELSNLGSTSLTAIEICNMLHNRTKVAPAKINLTCRRKLCLEQNNSKTISSSYNTPCGDHQQILNHFCFRGHCLPSGYTVKNMGCRRCLLSSNAPIGNKVVFLQECPNYVFRFDRVEVRKSSNSGYFIVATNNSPFLNEKCLTVSAELEIAYVECKLMHLFTWDVIKITSNATGFHLCHRESQMCLTSDTRNIIRLSEGLDFSDQFKLWTFEGLSLENIVFSSSRSEVAVNYYIELTFEVKLALVCDVSCGKHFYFNKEKVNEYWKFLLLDLHAKYRSLRKLKISFLVTSTSFLWNNELQSGNATLSLESLNEYFGAWAYQQIESLAPFDVALLTSAFGKDYQRFYTRSSSVCQTDRIQQKFIGTISTSVNIINIDKNCEDLGDAFAKIFGSLGTPQQACLGNKPQKLLNCGKLRYFFTWCEELLIREFLQSISSSCLKTSNNLSVQALQLHEQSRKFPIAPVVCNIIETNLTSQLENYICTVRLCSLGVNSTLLPNATRKVHPIYKTPCGKNKYCFWGRCFADSFQIRHLSLGKCMMSASNMNSAYGKVVLSDCYKLITPIDKIIIKTDKYGGVKLSTPYVVNGQISKSTGDKCVTVGSTTGNLVYKPCPLQTLEGFEWTFIEIGQNQSLYTLHHKATQSCVKYNNKTRTLDVGICNSNDKTMIWKLQESINAENFDAQNFKTYAENESDMLYIYVASAGILLASITVVGVIYKLQARNRQKSETIKRLSAILGEDFYKGAPSSIDPEKNIAYQADLLPFDRSWEISIDQLEIGRKLGSGAFGSVFEAIATGLLGAELGATVAVKTVSVITADSISLKAVTSELKIMSNLGRHLNIVNFLGACIKSFTLTKNLYIVLEFCKHGSLRDYIIKHKHTFVCTSSNTGTHSDSKVTDMQNKSPQILNNLDSAEGSGVFNLQDMICWSFQIARGMEYLESKRVLHGDLAARNTLLAEGNIAKICDFGFSKNLEKTQNYNYHKAMKEQALLPYKWMPIESIKYGTFSTKSDCWSYGVVLWELFSLGEQPYSGRKVDQAFVEDLCNGYRLDKPLHTSPRLYDIMLQCWAEDPLERPTFTELVKIFGVMVGQEIAAHFLQLDLEKKDMLHKDSTNNFLLKMDDQMIDTADDRG